MSNHTVPHCISNDLSDLSSDEFLPSLLDDSYLFPVGDSAAPWECFGSNHTTSAGGTEAPFSPGDPRGWPKEELEPLEPILGSVVLDSKSFASGGQITGQAKAVESWIASPTGFVNVEDDGSPTLDLRDLKFDLDDDCMLPFRPRARTSSFQWLCEECFIGFPTSQELDAHAKQERHRSYVCKECKKTYSRRDTHVRHMSRHKNSEVFACEFCKLDRVEKVFKRKDHLRQHQRKIHLSPSSKTRLCRSQLHNP